MGSEIILDQHDLGGVGEPLSDALEEATIIGFRSLGASFHEALPQLRRKGDQQTRCTTPLILVVLARDSALLDRQGGDNVTEELDRFFIETDQRSAFINRLRVEM